MKINSFKKAFLLAIAALPILQVSAQEDQPPMQVLGSGAVPAAESPAAPGPADQSAAPQGQTELQVLPWLQEVSSQRKALDYEPIREADVFWSKTLWRVIDCREKMNLPFKYPKKPFIDLLISAVESGEVPAFSANDDDFKYPMSAKEALAMAGSTTDTVYVPDAANPDILVPTVVTKEFDFEKVNRYRIKEVWYFNKQSSTMQVRVMGIAPIVDDFDEWGNFRGTKAIFWCYFPSLREILVQNEAYNPFPDGVKLTWDDIFAMRLFSSVVYKEDNVRDERIKDIYENPIDQLYESERIKEKIFNFEHDLWEY